MLQLQQVGRERTSPLPLSICSSQAHNRLDDALEYGGMLSADLNLLIQMLISYDNTLTDIFRNNA
jgi:hypothetical protein